MKGWASPRGEFPDASLTLRKMQGSFDSAGTSLREVPAALRMTQLLQLVYGAVEAAPLQNRLRMACGIAEAMP
jgi:hypothetical protein